MRACGLPARWGIAEARSEGQHDAGSRLATARIAARAAGEGNATNKSCIRMQVCMRAYSAKRKCE
jgi:hypothetical protein